MINENSNEENSISEVEKNIEAGRSLNPALVARAILGLDGRIKTGSKERKEYGNLKETIHRIIKKQTSVGYGKYLKMSQEEAQKTLNLPKNKEKRDEILSQLLENKELIKAFFENPTNRMSKGYGGKQKREGSEGLMSFLERILSNEISEKEKKGIIENFNEYQKNKTGQEFKTRKLGKNGLIKKEEEIEKNQQPTSEKIEINKDIENEFEEKIEEKQRKSSLNLDVFLGDLCLPEFYLPEKEEEKKERKGSDLFNKLSGEGFDPFKPF